MRDRDGGRIDSLVHDFQRLEHCMIRNLVEAALVPLVLILAVGAGLVTATASECWVHLFRDQR